MHIPQPRRFLLVDALILTAATAVGIVGTRHVWNRWGYAWFWNLQDGWSPVATFQRLPTLLALLVPMLAAWTLAILVARMIPPRPPLRRIALQPGATACGVAALVAAVETIGRAASLAYFEHSKGYLGATWNAFGFAAWFHTAVLLSILDTVGFGTVSTWVVLVLSRRLSPERSWIDRVGRVLGAFWVVAALLLWFNQSFLNGRLPGALSS
jgi:hypothetical protein